MLWGANRNFTKAIVKAFPAYRRGKARGGKATGEPEYFGPRVRRSTSALERIELLPAREFPIDENGIAIPEFANAKTGSTRNATHGWIACSIRYRVAADSWASSAISARASSRRSLISQS